jgi:hypothetical protein
LLRGGGTHADSQTARWSHTPTFIFFFQNKKSRLKKEASIETAEIKFCSSAAGYIRKDQMRNTKIREDLNVFNLNQNFKIQSQWKYYVLRMEDTRIPKKILSYNAKRRRNRVPTIKMEKPV